MSWFNYTMKTAFDSTRSSAKRSCQNEASTPAHIVVNFKKEDTWIAPMRRNQVIAAYREGLEQVLGAALDRVLLYGSHARGESGADSDIDVLCVMRDPFDYGELITRTSELTARLSLENDVVLSRSFVGRDDFETGQSPFLMNVRKEGVSV